MSKAKEITLDELIETIKGKIPQSGVIASILSAAMGAALATKILEALKSTKATEVSKACNTLQSVSKRAANSELSINDLSVLAEAALSALELVEHEMANTPKSIRSELLVSAMCCWTGLEGTLAMLETRLNLDNPPDSEQRRDQHLRMREAGKRAGKSAEHLAKK